LKEKAFDTAFYIDTPLLAAGWFICVSKCENGSQGRTSVGLMIGRLDDLLICRLFLKSGSKMEILPEFSSLFFI